MKKTKKFLKFLWRVVKLILPYIITAAENRLTKNCKGGDCSAEKRSDCETYFRRKEETRL